MISIARLRLRHACPKWWLMAALLPWLVACSTVRLTYGQGPMLTYWWMDRYVDFSSDQIAPARAALEDWFAWHRATQLTHYAALLASVAVQAKGQVTGSQVCDVLHQVEQGMLLGFEHGVPAMAKIIGLFSPEQLRHLEQRFAKADDTLAADYLERPKTEWQEKSRDRWLENMESFYGELDVQQRAKLAAVFEALPFDPQVWLTEQRQRHADIVATLRILKTQGADIKQIEAALRAFALMSMQSPREGYRTYRTRMKRAQCALIASVHNETSLLQRTLAAAKIKQYEADMRALQDANR